MSFRSSKNLERYECVRFNPDAPAAIPDNNSYQITKKLTFTPNISSDVNAFDW